MKKYKKKEMIIVLILTCLLFSCGPRVKNGFVKEGENTYYYVNDKMKKGWQEINEGWYFFFHGSGIMAKDTMIVDIDGKEYAFDDNGKMFKNKLTRVDVVRHRLDEKGRDVSRDNCNQVAYFGEDGAMLKNTQKDWGGKIYIIDENGIAKQQPDYPLVFNCTFPKLFRDGGTYNWSDVTIEKITYEVINDYNVVYFRTVWTGIAGNTSDGANHSTTRYVGYKLYDPDGYVVDSGTFYTDNSLEMGERFRNEEKRIGYGKIETKGIYRLELMDVR